MGQRYRLSTVVCMELVDAKDAADELSGEIERALQDGDITPDELEAIRRRKEALDKELREALVEAEKNDLVMGEFEYRLKVGPDAPLHKWLVQKRADVLTLTGHSAEDEPKRTPPTITARLVVKSRRKPPPGEAKSGSRRQAIGKD